MNMTKSAARNGDGLNGGVGVSMDFPSLAGLTVTTPDSHILAHSFPHKAG
jgi:hypothetical protein